MALLGGFFGQLGQQVGQNIIYGKEQENQQANIDFKKAEIASMQMSNLQKQQQMQSQKAIGQALATEAQIDNTTFTDPQKAATAYSKVASIAIQNGDFKSAEELSSLAKGKQDEMKVAAVNLANQQKAKKEAVSDSAYEFEANPNPDTANKLVRDAVAAGDNPTTIPPPGTPQFQAWVSQKKLSALDAKERASFTETVQTHAENAQIRRESLQQRAEDQAANRALRAQIQAGQNEFRSAHLDIERQRLQMQQDAAKAKAEAGPKLTGQERRDSQALAGASAEAARNVRQIGQFQIGTVGGGFTNLHDSGAVEAVIKQGTNAFTPEQTQMIQTAGAGLALQVGRVETIGGGRGINEGQIKQLEKQLTPTAGDHPIEALYKITTSADLVATRMRNQPPPTDPKLREEWDNTLKELESYPKPDQILKASKDPVMRRKLLQKDQLYSESLANIERGREKVRGSDVAADTTPGLPGSTDTGPVNKPPLPAAAGSGLPSGWSVKVK